MRIRIVDAFTDRPFAGNPAGVVVLDRTEFPSDEWMSRVAAEVNLSETAFVHPVAGDADYALRWFTPAVEVALCGHATLATAHVLGGSSVVRFDTRSGILTATPGDDGWITLDFPTAPLTPVEPDPRLLDMLGATPISVHHTGPNTDDLMLELVDEAAVRDLTPDLSALAGYERRGVVVTARADKPDAGYDFVSRFFGAAAGVGEDPVTGSAHTALAPFWSGRLGGRTELVGYQASARGGFVRVSLRGDRTRLTGKAVTVIDGELLA
ncbi:PhzF family phenazine biosynthesis protein [Actinoplanes sp. LDG1-06]|uniref:PhzF family phenazine biosynthesis protein n=1 Tax=Paractinoplanes ovalisporus TaxID=2810368 RepID=A0ABS2AN49_9ACTN|nr:PhzF family phenazine biosynthesis protein [Actinoplanes ovalisporus]MBM2621283.1 PhzF family phenazine biosynthesis protein [Actinoplanes ovalisporus]